MRRFKLAPIFLLVLAMALGLAAGVAAGPPDGAVGAKEERGKPVKVNGKDMKLWVFVFPERGGKPAPSTAHCTDGDQGTTVPAFATANPGGLTFNINYGSIPIDKASAIGAIQASFATWDAVSAAAYFTVNNSGGASGPAADGNNTMGWVRIVPKNVLAAAWVWTDANNVVTEADIFYNAFHKWGVYTTCNAQSAYEVGDVGTHEVGHVVALDHLSDANGYATLYPSAAKGEVRKRTLTTGDAAGYLAAGGY